MAKAVSVQRVRFVLDCFERGELRYARGRHYALCPTTVGEVIASGNAELVELEVDADQHARETAEAHARWNARHGVSIDADPSLRDQPNPAAALVQARLAELAARAAK